MSTVNNVEARIKKARITEDEIIAHLVDGRTISVPLTWSWRQTIRSYRNTEKQL